MKKLLFLLLFPFGVLAEPAQPHDTIEFTTPVVHIEGNPITDLESVTFSCNGVEFTIPTTLTGTAHSEPLPAGVLALSGHVVCTGYATSTSEGPGPLGVTTWEYSCAFGHCYLNNGPMPQTSEAPPIGSSNLAIAAAGLNPGQTLLFSQTPQRDPTFEDLKWQSVTYHDPIHGRILLIGKAAGATVPHWWSVYEEASDTWSTPQDFITGANGHVYGGITKDPATGDFYFKEYGVKFLRVLDSATLTWSQTSTWVIANTSTVPHSSTVYHPNLYGAGDGGVVIDAGFGSQPVIGWRKATDTWAIIASGGSPGRTGQGAYFAALDIAVNGGSDNAGNAGILVSPGPVATAGTTFPLRIAGDTFGNTNIGAMMQSPTDPAKLWIVQNGDTVNDGRRVYESTDAVTWTQIADHPFVVAEGGIWVSMPAYGVVGFIDANDGAMWLWKP